MLSRLLLLVLIVPFLEIYVLIQIGRRIGAIETILLIILMGMLGAALVRRAGAHAVGRIQSELTAGRLPADDIIDALLIFVAGILFIIPGILSDVVGFLMLLPPMRAMIRARLRRRFEGHIVVVRPGGSEHRDDFIDIEPTSAQDIYGPERRLE